jgi:hypothetical protein
MLFTKYYYDDQIKEDEMGDMYRAKGRTQTCTFELVNQKGRDLLRDLGVDGKIIIKSK